MGLELGALVGEAVGPFGQPSHVASHFSDQYINAQLMVVLEHSAGDLSP